MDINHICFIVSDYPTQNDPVFTFVRQLICSITDLGVKCSVIAPQSITNSCIRRKSKRPFSWQDTTDENNKVEIYQPNYISFSNMKIFGISISSIISQRATINTFAKLNIKPDVLYAHFWHCGVTAGIIGGKYKVPVFVATGESKISVMDVYREKKVKTYLKNVKGAICVSSKNMQESLGLNLVSKEKMIVIPNAVNNKLFYPMDKTVARKKLGFKDKDFIVAFTGAFNHRKGVLRLSEAIEKVGEVKSIYIGSGNLKPRGDNILFMGRLPHDRLVTYLNASDVFVLPTLAEGCCNAIIEAMACGLPIISSYLPFNDDIIDDSNSIRIDPNSIEEIANAIKYLKENPGVRKEMAYASLEKAKDLDIESRAKKIMEFMMKYGDK